MSFFDRVAREDHHRQSESMCSLRKRRSRRCVSQWLAAEKSDSFDIVVDLRSLNSGYDFINQDPLPAVKRQHLRIATARATHRTALEPKREALARSLGLGAINPVRNIRNAVGSHDPSISGEFG